AAPPAEDQRERAVADGEGEADEEVLADPARGDELDLEAVAREGERVGLRERDQRHRLAAAEHDAPLLPPGPPAPGARGGAPAAGRPTEAGPPRGVGAGRSAPRAAEQRGARGAAEQGGTRERSSPPHARRRARRTSRGRSSSSIFAARMKSFTVSPPTACVQISITTRPHPSVISGWCHSSSASAPTASVRRSAAATSTNSNSRRRRRPPTHL